MANETSRIWINWSMAVRPASRFCWSLMTGPENQLLDYTFWHQLGLCQDTVIFFWKNSSKHVRKHILQDNFWKALPLAVLARILLPTPLLLWQGYQTAHVSSTNYVIYLLTKIHDTLNWFQKLDSHLVCTVIQRSCFQVRYIAVFHQPPYLPIPFYHWHGHVGKTRQDLNCVRSYLAAADEVFHQRTDESSVWND